MADNGNTTAAATTAPMASSVQHEQQQQQQHQQQHSPVESNTQTAPAPAPATPLNFRTPSTSTSSTPSIIPFTPSTAQWMSGPWHVTHSTLPMWKSNRNVIIHYTLHPTLPNTFDNLVEYYPLKSDKRKTVAGVEKADAKVPAAWNWRGKGWLMIASSHWEVLGWGEDEDGWMVTFFDKTLFTPAGIDVLCRRREGVSREVMGRIRAEIERVEDQAFAKLAGEMFEVKRD